MIPVSIKILDVTWQVQIKDPESFPDLRGNAGLTDNDKRVISLSSNLTEEGLRDTLNHEILHAISYQSGFSHRLSEMVGDTMAEKLEEDICLTLAPIYLYVMKKLSY